LLYKELFNFWIETEEVAVNGIVIIGVKNME